MVQTSLQLLSERAEYRTCPREREPSRLSLPKMSCKIPGKRHKRLGLGYESDSFTTAHDGMERVGGYLSCYVLCHCIGHDLMRRIRHFLLHGVVQEEVSDQHSVFP